MIIKQDETEFRPITITLDTREEAEAFWMIIRRSPVDSDEEAGIAFKISNWFSNHAKL